MWCFASRISMVGFAAVCAPLLPIATARAQALDAPRGGSSSASAASDGATSSVAAPAAQEDPTGGAYTTPTLLFVPAGALPRWTVRVIGSTEIQTPSDVHAGIRPGLGVELGLPAGLTFGAGTNWVGGDINPHTGNTDFNLGLSPYLQGRIHVLGSADGMGFQLGSSVTYKFVGFEGDPGETEFAISSQYRHRHFELGLQGTIGKDLATVRVDGEIHAYALYRVLPQLGLGAAGQARIAIVTEPDGTTYDVIGGVIASLTIDRYQIAALVGASTIGLAQEQVGAMGQVFGTARF
jgi:hypothetical protein